MRAESKSADENGLALGGLDPRMIVSRAAVVAAVFALIVFGLLRLSSDDQTGAGQAVVEPQAATGLTAFQAGDFPQAITILKKAAKADPTDAPALMLLGQSYEATGELDEAVAAYQASLKVDPDQPQVLYNVGIIYQFQGKSPAAQKYLEKAIAFNEGFAGARIALGDLFAENGQEVKARQMYREVIDAAPAGIELDRVEAKLKAVR